MREGGNFIARNEAVTTAIPSKMSYMSRGRLRWFE